MFDATLSISSARSWVAAAAAAVLAGACAQTPKDPNAEPESDADRPANAADFPVDLPPVPEPGMEIRTPWYSLPGGSERMLCFFGTFEEDMGVHWYEWFHHPEYGHHMRISKVESDPEAFPDGSWVDCLDLSIYEEIGNQRNLFNANEAGVINGRMDLEDGAGVVVRAGERWMVQSHFINATNEDVSVQDVIHLGTMPLEDVVTPISTWTFSGQTFTVEPGAAAAVTNVCRFPGPVGINMIMVHMHESATSFVARYADGENAGSVMYELPEWEDIWRTEPLLYLPSPPIEVSTGQGIEFTCNFFNESDTPLVWPTEMCVFEGMASPLTRSVDCVDGDLIVPPSGPR